VLSAPVDTVVRDAIGVALATLQLACMLYIVLSFAWEVYHAPRHHRR
jgi:hypothetical protein